MISITGSGVGFIAWMRRDERDRYSKERQLQHALDNFSATNTAIAQLEDRVNEGFQQVTLELSQVKTVLAMRPTSDQIEAAKAWRRGHG